MKRRIGVLCALREEQAIWPLMQELDDGERCVFDIAHGGKHALELYERSAPDVLIVDDVLPGIDGLGLLDCIIMHPAGKMPVVIGRTMMPFSRSAFARRGVKRLMDVSCPPGEIKAMFLEAASEAHNNISWQEARRGVCFAQEQLLALGMKKSLRGYAYLSCAAGLAALDETCLSAIGERIYAPIARRFGTTAASVERLIRHAVESTVDSAKAAELYAFFGNTIDPMRGKPTNAQMIGMLAQKVRIMLQTEPGQENG